MVHGARGGGAWSQPIKYSASGSLNESADTPYDPVGGTQGPQEAHGKHLFIPGGGCGGGGSAMSKSIKYSASGNVNESADTPYDPLGGPQGPQEAHGKHLFVPGAGAVGQIDMTLG